MVGDSEFTCNTEEFAQKLANHGNNVYRYFYNHQSSANPWPAWSGSKHGDEIEFTFGVPSQNPKPYTASEIEFSKDLITYWTNFAKTGSPDSSNHLAAWPKYQDPEWKYLNLTLTIGMKYLIGMQNLNQRCKFFNEIVPKHLPVEKDEGSCQRLMKLSEECKKKKKGNACQRLNKLANNCMKMKRKDEKCSANSKP